MSAKCAYHLLFLSLVIINSITVGLVSGVASISNGNKDCKSTKDPLKCVVVEGQPFVRVNNEDTVLDLGDADTWSSLMQNYNDISTIIFTSTSGRTLCKSSFNRSSISGYNEIQMALMQKISNSPSGIYTLYLTNNSHFYPAVGDTSDSSAGTGDIDGDGYDDVILAGTNISTGVPPRLFLSDGSGGLIEVSERLPQIDMMTQDIIVFDADNDQDLDLFFVNIDERNRLFINDGNGFFSDESDIRIPADTLAHTAGDFVDIDDDNDNDLLITGFDALGYGELESYNMILVNDGEGHFTDESVSRFVGGIILDASMDGVFIDIENDDDPDILISNDSFFYHRTTLYQNDGTGHFTDVTEERLPELIGSSWNISVDDFIPDQYPDIYIANSWNELNFLLENDRSGTFYDVSTLRTPYTSSTDSSFTLACTDLDINLDGIVDIIVGNSYDVIDSTHPAQNRVLLNDGNGFFADVTNSTPPLISIIEDDTWDLDVLDANNDERSDLFVTNLLLESVLYLNRNGSLSVKDERGQSVNIIPKAYALHQNYPNPFNPTTTISFDVPEEKQQVKLTVYDLRGRHVKTLINSELEPGSHKVVWDGHTEHGNTVSSGVYIYNITGNNTSYSRKMIMLK